MQQPIKGHQRPPFTALPNWIGGRATALQIAVLFALAYHAPDIHPSHQRLAAVAGMSRRTVQRVLSELEARKWVRALPQQNSSGAQEANQYVLNIWPGDDQRIDHSREHPDAEGPRLQATAGQVAQLTPPASERRTPLRQADAPPPCVTQSPPCVRETHKQEKNLPYWFTSTFNDQINKCSSSARRPETESAAVAASSRSLDGQQQSSTASSRPGALLPPLAALPVKPAEPAGCSADHSQPEEVGAVPRPLAASAPPEAQARALPWPSDTPEAPTCRGAVPGPPGVMPAVHVSVPQRFAALRPQITAWLQARARAGRGAALELTTADEEAMDFAAAQGVLPAFLADAERRAARSLAYQHKAVISKLHVNPAVDQVFARFKAIYLAIPERALGQTVTKARTEFVAALRRGFTGEQIVGALQRERSAQLANLRADRFAAPFPDMARWLRDGRFEAWIDATAAAATGQPSPSALASEPKQEAYPTAEAWHEAHRQWRVQRWGSTS